MSFTSLLIVVACAALLAGCEARLHSNNSTIGYGVSVILGKGPIVTGSNVIILPEIKLKGPDVTIGFPDNCAIEGLQITMALVIIANLDGLPFPDVVSDDPYYALSNMTIHCRWDDVSRCLSGLSVNTFQYCGDPIASPTTNKLPTPSILPPWSIINKPS